VVSCTSHESDCRYTQDTRSVMPVRLMGTLPLTISKTTHSLSISAHSYRSLLLSTIDSVCLSVCHAPSNCFFFIVSRWNRAIFGHYFSMTPSTKRCSYIFDLGPLMPKITPQISTKSPISRLVWQIERRCLGLPGDFRGWPIQWNHAKCCGPTLVAVATKFGLGAEI